MAATGRPASRAVDEVSQQRVGRVGVRGPPSANSSRPLPGRRPRRPGAAAGGPRRPARDRPASPAGRAVRARARPGGRARCRGRSGRPPTCPAAPSVTYARVSGPATSSRPSCHSRSMHPSGSTRPAPASDGGVGPHDRPGQPGRPLRVHVAPQATTGCPTPRRVPMLLRADPVHPLEGAGQGERAAVPDLAGDRLDGVARLSRSRSAARASRQPGQVRHRRLPRGSARRGQRHSAPGRISACGAVSGSSAQVYRSGRARWAGAARLRRLRAGGRGGGRVEGLAAWPGSLPRSITQPHCPEAADATLATGPAPGGCFRIPRLVRRVGALHMGAQPGRHVVRGQEAGPALGELGGHVGSSSGSSSASCVPVAAARAT